MEKDFLDALRDSKSVSVKIELGYANSNTQRPNVFNIVAIINGKKNFYNFEQ